MEIEAFMLLCKRVGLMAMRVTWEEAKDERGGRRGRGEWG